MVIFRLENKDGNGPYYGARSNGTEKQKEMLIEHNWSERHPAPCDDGITVSQDGKKDFRFGFESQKQLEDWFEHFLPHLFDIGFEVKQYFIHDDFVRENVVFGTRQLAFNRTAAEQWDRLLTLTA